MDFESTGLDDLMETILGVLCMMLVAAATVTLFSVSLKYDNTVADKLQQKSSTYFVPYAMGDENLYMNADAVIEDVAVNSVPIWIDQTALTIRQLDGIRIHDAGEVLELRGILGSFEYKKVTTYDTEGNVTGIKFLRRNN